MAGEMLFCCHDVLIADEVHLTIDTGLSQERRRREICGVDMAAAATVCLVCLTCVCGMPTGDSR